MGRTGRPHYSLLTTPSAIPHDRTGTEPHAPRATAGRGPNRVRGPGTGRTGAARRCTSGTVDRGPNRDYRPWTGRGGFASTHAHPGTAGRETILV
jgi:hypothetical protein